MDLLTWGANSYGQLGVGYKSEQLEKPTRINLPFSAAEIKDIQIGGGHTFILTKSGKLFACGWNNKGQLGIEGDLVIIFTPLIYNLKFDQVACGWDFTAAILENKKLLVWGSNTYQQIGLTKDVKQINIPTICEHIQAVKIACGLRHLLVLTIDGKVMACGSGTKGQLGLVDETGYAIRQSDLQIIPHLDDIVDLACGQYHSLALDNKRTLYGWGSNKYGQLAFDSDICMQIFTPIELSLEIDFDIFSVKAGWTHTLVTTLSEEIYTFGRNNYGQLGGSRIDNWAPGKVPLKGSGCAGSEHNLVLTKSDKRTLYSWGWNEHGNCGVGHTENVLVPAVVIEGGVNMCFTGGAQCFAIVGATDLNF